MMFMAMRANPKHRPWLIAAFAAVLAVGIGVMVS